jgi:hypothetical protein
MVTRIRRLVLIAAAASGVVAATTLPAYAGVMLSNHCEPIVTAGASQTRKGI